MNKRCQGDHFNRKEESGNSRVRNGEVPDQNLRDKENADLGLYIHIPFCVRKCLYCDFLSFPVRGREEDLKKAYAAALIKEIRAYGKAARGRSVTSIFIGGGTPSVMPAESLEEIFRAIEDTFDISPDSEITMEMNPGTVDERMLLFAQSHLNRVSLGVQSFRDPELKTLGRIHTSDEAERCFWGLRAAGIGNINIDLMYGLPGQSPESFRESLARVTELEPEHVSAYSLIVEEHTPFGKLFGEGKLSLPDEDEERTMANLAEDTLCGTGGYEHYEISNFAKEGFRCRHNVRYWKRGDYLGFGPGAASLFDECRWSNTRNFKTYMTGSADPHQIMRNVEHLTKKAEMEEFMFLGLRMTEGISKARFRDAFGTALETVYGPVLLRHIEEGVMKRTPDGYALTHRGMEVSNPVMADYLLD